MTFEPKQIENALKELYGFKRTGRQRGSHTEMATDAGHRVNPKFTKKDTCLRSLQSLRRELDAVGLDGRRFWTYIRA